MPNPGDQLAKLLEMRHADTLGGSGDGHRCGCVSLPIQDWCGRTSNAREPLPVIDDGGADRTTRPSRVLEVDDGASDCGRLAEWSPTCAA